MSCAIVVFLIFGPRECPLKRGRRRTVRDISLSFYVSIFYLSISFGRNDGTPLFRCNLQIVKENRYIDVYYVNLAVILHGDDMTLLLSWNRIHALSRLLRQARYMIADVSPHFSAKRTKWKLTIPFLKLSFVRYLVKDECAHFTAKLTRYIAYSFCKYFVSFSLFK